MARYNTDGSSALAPSDDSYDEMGRDNTIQFPRNKIGYENEPDYSTLKGAQAEESSSPRQASPRSRAANAAKNAEDTAAGVQKAASAAGKFGSGNYVGAAKDALGAVSSFKNSTQGKDEKSKKHAAQKPKNAARRPV